MGQQHAHRTSPASSVMGRQRPAAQWLRRARLWQCPSCGKTYPRAGQVHSCRRVALPDHFEGKPHLRRSFNAYLRLVREAGGPVRLSVARTRIGIMREITFSAVYPRQRGLRVTFLLFRRLRSPRIIAAEHFPPYWLHTVAIKMPRDLDEELRAYLREAYDVGMGLRPRAR